MILVAFHAACHVGDKAVVAKVAFPTLLDKVIGIGDVAKVSEEFISTGQSMSEGRGGLVETRTYFLFLTRLWIVLRSRGPSGFAAPPYGPTLVLRRCGSESVEKVHVINGVEVLLSRG